MTDLRNPLLGEQSISNQLISDKPVELCVALCPFIQLHVRKTYLQEKGVCMRSEHVLNVPVLTDRCIFSCVCVDILTCLFMCAYRCMCNCVCVFVTPSLTFFVSAWVLNYSCVCVCSLCVLVCVSVAPVISLLLPTPTPVLQLTCSVLGPIRSHRPTTAF